MLLFLDDKRLPPTWAEKKPAAGSNTDGVWYLVKTAGEAIELLKTGKVEVISLDHDLGPTEAGTGYDVAKWIEERIRPGSDGSMILLCHIKDQTFRRYPLPLWHVHSSNPVGARNIAAALRHLPRLSDAMVRGLRLPPEVPALIEPECETEGEDS